MRADSSGPDLTPRLAESISEAKARVRIGYPWWMRVLLARDVIAITIGRRIYFRRTMASPVFERILRHELVHVQQVNELGLIRFLWRYLAEFFRHWRRLRNAAAAYSAISFEVAARAAEDEPAL